MKRGLIKKLADSSFRKGTLDESSVNKIEKHLSRKDLKVYIKDLKNINSEKIVTITIPNEDGIKDMEIHFKRMYPNKKILVNIDEELINGIRVEDQNNEYEFSLKSFMEEAYKATND